jgi:hypothetical protein
LEKVTGITGLKHDPLLEGGGLHQCGNGGFLNVHADFTCHPHKLNWRRRVNVLVYLNENWKTEFGGNLELWSTDMSSCKRSIEPYLNRAVIFKTDETSFHGFPDPITCPPDVFRKSIALYYFTEEAAFKRSSTDYRARPKDGLKGIFIFLDKKAVALYSKVKRVLGLDDGFISTILGIFGRKK